MTHVGKLTDVEKVGKIREYKEKGNTFYKTGDYKKASQSYYRGILFIKGLSTYSEDLTAGLQSLLGGDGIKPKPFELDVDTKTLICDCYNNLAACMLKESEPKYDRIVEFCDNALAVSPNNVKALYRKGSSQYACKYYEEALKTLGIAQHDANVRKLMEQCKVQIKEDEKELAQRYKSIFKS